MNGALVWLAVAGLNSLAWQANAQTAIDNNALCMAIPAPFDSSQLLQKKQVQVTADAAEIRENQFALFDGNVDIVTDSAIIHANTAEVTDNGRALSASGNVSYRSPALTVSSDLLSVDSVEQTLKLENTQYQLTGFVGHGAAGEIDIGTQQGIALHDVSFTTCPLDQQDWRLEASKISIEPGDTLGEARHTRFYLGDVPVLYLPYFAFPVSNQRQTGLLFPIISSSSATGVDYEQPFYWNIAPNYDMTISPRLMTNRGLQLKTEFRYLTNSSGGQMHLEYLNNDTKLASDDSRYFYRLQHHGMLSDNWQLNVDFNGISDNNYVVDLGSDFYNRSDTTINRTIGLDYYSQSLDMSLYLRDFETLGDFDAIYRALPEAKLQWRNSLGELLTFKVDSELAYFDNAQETRPDALRWHLAPTVALLDDDCDLSETTTYTGWSAV